MAEAHPAPLRRDAAAITVTGPADEERIKAAERAIAGYAARQQAMRGWAAANQDVPLGRITALLIAEDGKAEDLPGFEGPDYYGGLGFALNAIMDEVAP